jgi:hypothetical protein
MRTLPIGIWTRTEHRMAIRRSAGAGNVARNMSGFTLFEMIIVLFLLGGVLALVVPRIVVGEDLGATGRSFITVLRNLQGMAVTSQKPIKLYLDLDEGSYWVMQIEGKEEKLPLDVTWLTRRSLPESVRFTDVSVGGTKRVSGRMDLLIFPNGRIDPLTIHFKDGNNNILAVAVESVTGAIRTSDERIDPPVNQPIPERIRVLLQPATTGGLTPAALGIKF